MLFRGKIRCSMKYRVLTDTSPLVLNKFLSNLSGIDVTCYQDIYQKKFAISEDYNPSIFAKWDPTSLLPWSTTCTFTAKYKSMVAKFFLRPSSMSGSLS